MKLRIQLGVVLSTATSLCFAQTTFNAPLVVPPSGYWDGVDGPWSTFEIGVGYMPYQLFRFVPAMSHAILMLPVESPGCNKTTSKACRERETYTQRTTAEVSQNLLLDNDLISLLPKLTNGTREIGLEHVVIGHNTTGTFAADDQPVLGVTSPDFFAGVFGLAMTLKHQRFMVRSNTFAMENISSYSLSYTAGSAKRNTTGSLILGGYDTSLFNASTTLSVDIPESQNNTLIVSVKAIYALGRTSAHWSPPAQSQPTSFRVDSLLPQIWLPIEACTIFEKIFDLSWDDRLQLYLVNETVHSRLLFENPKVSFLLGDRSNASFRNFTLSYAAFDLQLAPPLVSKATYYFPIRRATDPKDYLLGRVFLQETYITVDYERRNFSLSEADFSQRSGAIVPILNNPATNGTSNKNGTDQRLDKTNHTRLPKRVYVGIGISSGVLILILVAILLSWHKGWGVFRKSAKAENMIVKKSSQLNGVPESVESMIVQDCSHRNDVPESVKNMIVQECSHRNGVPRAEAMGELRVELSSERRVEAMGRNFTELETLEPSLEAGGPRSPTTETVAKRHELDGNTRGNMTATSVD